MVRLNGHVVDCGALTRYLSLPGKASAQKGAYLIFDNLVSPLQQTSH